MDEALPYSQECQHLLTFHITLQYESNQQDELVILFLSTLIFTCWPEGRQIQFLKHSIIIAQFKMEVCTAENLFSGSSVTRLL